MSLENLKLVMMMMMMMKIRPIDNDECTQVLRNRAASYCNSQCNVDGPGETTPTSSSVVPHR